MSKDMKKIENKNVKAKIFGLHKKRYLGHRFDFSLQAAWEMKATLNCT